MLFFHNEAKIRYWNDFPPIKFLKPGNGITFSTIKLLKPSIGHTFSTIKFLKPGIWITFFHNKASKTQDHNHFFHNKVPKTWNRNHFLNPEIGYFSTILIITMLKPTIGILSFHNKSSKTQNHLFFFFQILDAIFSIIKLIKPESESPFTHMTASKIQN